MNDEDLHKLQVYYELMAMTVKYQKALRSIVNVLGPEICSCENGCGLHEEAHEALRTAITALLGAD